MNKIYKCDVCGSYNTFVEEREINPGSCGDPECCGINYEEECIICCDCKHWEFITTHSGEYKSV